MRKTLLPALAGAALLTTALISCTPSSTSLYEATIRRTTHNIPHITASDLPSLGFGEGYAQAEDHLCSLADQIVKARGERAKYFGAGPDNAHLYSDIAMRALDVRDGASEELAQMGTEMQQWYDGYVAGYNQYLGTTGADNVPGWCQGAEWVQPITAQDLAAYHRSVTLVSTRFAGMIATATPPETATSAVDEAEGEQVAAFAPDLDATLDAALSTALEPVQQLGASNGWAIGGDYSTSGGGMLIANPHYPWMGSNRFWEKHLTIPGEMDVYGVGLVGIPGVSIGFNDSVGWTHTVSAGTRYTIYALDLAEGAPTSYSYGDEQREITSESFTVEVKDEDGSISEHQHTVWFSHYGPIVNFPGVSWSAEHALALRDANELNEESRQQWMDMNKAGSFAEFKAAHADNQGMPWVNTIAAAADGTAWYVDSSSTPNLSAEALAAWQQLAESDPMIGGMAQRGVIVLPGSDPRFEWQADPGARDPGVVAFADMPQLERRDYVFNANDSFWLANSSALIEGDYSPLHGEQGSQRSLRTRNNDLTLAGLSPDDPNGDDDKFTLDEMASALISNRSMTAELLRPELIPACKRTSKAQGRNGTVDLDRACSVLEAWDDRFDLDSKGAVLFREWLGQYESADLRGKGRLFAVDYDRNDPVNTPRGLADRELALRHLAQAVEILEGAGHAIDVTLRELQYAPSKMPERIPVHGGHGSWEGIKNMQQFSGNGTTLEPVELGEPVEGSRFLRSEGYPIGHGSSFLMALEFTADGPNAQAFLTYSQSGDPNSEFFRDQTKLYAEKQWRPILFTEDEIAANVLETVNVKYEKETD